MRSPQLVICSSWLWAFRVKLAAVVPRSERQRDAPRNRMEIQPRDPIPIAELVSRVSCESLRMAQLETMGLMPPYTEGIQSLHARDPLLIRLKYGCARCLLLCLPTSISSSGKLKGHIRIKRIDLEAWSSRPQSEEYNKALLEKTYRFGGLKLQASK